MEGVGKRHRSFLGCFNKSLVSVPQRTRFIMLATQDRRGIAMVWFVVALFLLGMAVSEFNKSGAVCGSDGGSCAGTVISGTSYLVGSVICFVGGGMTLSQ